MNEYSYLSLFQQNELRNWTQKSIQECEINSIIKKNYPLRFNKSCTTFYEISQYGQRAGASTEVASKIVLGLFDKLGNENSLCSIF